ncbi:MAG: hypothetical protein OEV90_07830, partial [Gammaproteobacteria bacterium]|nr:hypothetical protein [Gammaproteobacteria bacterium]
MPTRVLHRARPGSMVRWHGPLTGAWLACTLVSGCALGQAAGGPPPVVKEKAVTNVPAEMIEAALDDAANRSTTARAAITVTSAEAVTWPDGSLGCPQPGMMYTQALVAGYRIVLQAGEQTLNYHA